MRVMNTLTQNIIDNLTQLLKDPGHDTLQSLSVCAPVLIDELQQIKNNALDRRDIIPLVQSVLDEWLKQHPQPEGAIQDLQVALQNLGRPGANPGELGGEACLSLGSTSSCLLSW